MYFADHGDARELAADEEAILAENWQYLINFVERGGSLIAHYHDYGAWYLLWVAKLVVLQVSMSLYA